MKPIEIIGALLTKNRSWVSQDFGECIDFLGKEVPLTIHRYPTGSEYSTWNIPEEWNVIKAELTDGDKVLASYSDHPLFLAPYSCGFTGWLSKEELLAHVKTSPQAPDAFTYEYRLESDYRRRLKEWIITLPHNMLETLDRQQYYVDIQIETKPGNMLVADSTVQGNDGYIFAFLTHLCHPGQANDGLAGVAVGIEAMKRIKQEFPNPNHSYQLLILPETLGSSVFLSDNDSLIDQYLGSTFIEMPGLTSPLSLKATRRGNTYLDRVQRQVAIDSGLEFTECGFREQWGNDEQVFDSPGVGIPGASVQRFPFHWYHTSGDDMEKVDETCLEETVQILVSMARLMESDFIPVPLQRIPVYLTRYDLYADAINDRSEFDINIGVNDLLSSGISVFDMSLKLGAPYERVHSYLAKFLDLGLIGSAPITPEYFRKGLD